MLDPATVGKVRHTNPICVSILSHTNTGNRGRYFHLLKLKALFSQSGLQPCSYLYEVFSWTIKNSHAFEKQEQVNPRVK